jgi:hypothetical protein
MLSMKAVIPSYQVFFTTGSFPVGLVECWVVLVCKLGGTKLSQADETVSQNGDTTTVVAVAETCHMDREIAVMGFSSPMKMTCIVKLPCGTTKNHFKKGQRLELCGRLELWAKPELELDQNYKTALSILEKSQEDEFGEITVNFGF